MFAPDVKDELINTVVPRMQDESFKAYLDMMLLSLPSTKPTSVPLLMIGGKDDFLISTSSIKKNANQLGAAFELMNGGHNINLEEGWEKIAEKIEFFFGAEKGERWGVRWADDFYLYTALR